MKTTSLRLAKQNFKFSSAHFLIFDQKSAEMLHGHNYQVVVSILAPDVGNDADDVGKMGYMVDFNVLKKFIKARLDVWDEHVLLPKNHPDMKSVSSSNGKNYEVTFRDRFYSFPKEEVIWLNCSNTSVEQLSSILAEEFFREFKKYGIARITVAVEETRGQSAATTIE